MDVVFFGTYESARDPRVKVLYEGFRARGDTVVDCNVPLDLGGADRVRMLRRPWLALQLQARVVKAWIGLWRRAREIAAADAVVVGFFGHVDVWLARVIVRRRWKRASVALDYMVSLRDTALDRRMHGRVLLGVLGALDEGALRRTDVVIVDTDEHRATLPARHRDRAVVTPVGASEEWFTSGSSVATASGSRGALRVVFFGKYTPLQGAPVIGRAIAMLSDRDDMEFTMIGHGQDFEETRRLVGDGPVQWIDWVEPEGLPAVVADHHVCLGIFGTGPKAHRVVPNKLYQGAAVGCALVTSDTPPQRRAFDTAASFVPAGDAEALVAALSAFARDRESVAVSGKAARALAEERFRPVAAVAPLRATLLDRVER